MKFNIAYMGPEELSHLRRDFMLVLKYSLEDLGHDVMLSVMSMERSCFNLLIGAYALTPGTIHQIAKTGFEYAHINTEVIANDMLNHQPEKTDFLGAYLPSMEDGRFVWDVIMDNMTEHKRYVTKAHFLRWGSHPKMADIEHSEEKDLDFYFFGMMSERRRRLLRGLQEAGLKGASHDRCPYFVRNDRIARARVQLNLIQEDKYTHVNSFRICYLANNACCILSENESDPANYLQYAEIIDPNHLAESVREYAQGDAWKRRGEAARASFDAIRMNQVMEHLLEESFSSKLR